MDMKELLKKFAAFLRTREAVASAPTSPKKLKEQDDEIVADFLMTLPTDGDPVCTHCGSNEVTEADFKDRPLFVHPTDSAKNEPPHHDRGPAWLCKCGYWTHRKVGVVDQMSGWK